MTEQEFNALVERIWAGRRSLYRRHIPLDEIFVIVAEEAYAGIIHYLRRSGGGPFALQDKLTAFGVEVRGDSNLDLDDVKFCWEQAV